MLLFGTRICLAKALLALVFIDVAIAAAIKTAEIASKIPDGKRIKFGFYTEPKESE